jgi:hypothetical protein
VGNWKKIVAWFGQDSTTRGLATFGTLGAIASGGVLAWQIAIGPEVTLYQPKFVTLRVHDPITHPGKIEIHFEIPVNYVNEGAEKRDATLTDETLVLSIANKDYRFHAFESFDNVDDSEAKPKYEGVRVAGATVVAGKSASARRVRFIPIPTQCHRESSDNCNPSRNAVLVEKGRLFEFISTKQLKLQISAYEIGEGKKVGTVCYLDGKDLVLDASFEVRGYASLNCYVKTSK